MIICKFNNSFGCLPSTHVEASLKGWPNNHVRGCILEELLVFVTPAGFSRKSLSHGEMETSIDVWIEA